MPQPGVFLAVVERPDELPETEAVEISTNAAGLAEIVLTDGTRITLTEQIFAPSTSRAAA